MVVKWPFISCYFLRVSQACTKPPFTSEAIKFTAPIRPRYGPGSVALPEHFRAVTFRGIVQVWFINDFSVPGALMLVFMSACSCDTEGVQRVESCYRFKGLRAGIWAFQRHDLACTLEYRAVSTGYLTSSTCHPVLKWIFHKSMV